jgi:crotonobetainyl-CoA:carnitine CoA-transferase CaiB-like acyl-CoA transferase
MALLAFLRFLRVSQVGEGAAGAWACEVLASLGASVAAARGAQPDITICDRVSSVPAPFPLRVDDYAARVNALNRSVWVTISAFGLSGPRADALAGDLTLSAASGVLSLVRDGAGKPRPLPGEQTLLAAGQAAALGALHGLDQFRLHRHPVHVEVSAQEAMLATGPVLQCAERLLNFSIRGGTRRFGPPFGQYPCTDGFVYIGAAEQHHLDGVWRAIGAPELAERIRGTAARVAETEVIDRLVRGWTSARSKAECQSALQAQGVPATAFNGVVDILASPQFGHRNQWREVEMGGTRVKVMSSPFVVTAAPASNNGASGPGSGIAGLRVAEAGHILAASLAGALLGAMGAAVTKIEDPQRLDFYRRSGPFIDGVEDDEWSGYFAIANHSKVSRLCSGPDEIQAAVAGSEVVLENWGVRRATRARVDSVSVVARWPSKLGVSSSGFGQSGPQSGYRAYAYNLNAFCGLTALLQGDSENLPALEMAWADFTSAYALATVVAAWAAGPAYLGIQRRSAALDISMAEVVVQRLNGPILRSQLADPPGSYVDWSNGAGGAYILPTDGSRHLIAVSAPTGRERRLLIEALQAPSEDLTLEDLVRLSSSADGEALASRLVAAGVEAAVVLNADDLVADQHLLERRFFTEVEHPDWGRRRLIGLPWRFAGEGPIALRPPPRVGTGSDLEVSRRLSGQGG